MMSQLQDEEDDDEIIDCFSESEEATSTYRYSSSCTFVPIESALDSHVDDFDQCSCLSTEWSRSNSTPLTYVTPDIFSDSELSESGYLSDSEMVEADIVSTQIEAPKRSRLRRFRKATFGRLINKGRKIVHRIAGFILTRTK